jgi:HEAT repeat protein
MLQRLKKKQPKSDPGFGIIGSMQAMATKKRMSIALGIFLLVVLSAVLVVPGSRDQVLAFVRPRGSVANNVPKQPSTLDDVGLESDSERAKSALGPLTGGIADIPGLLEKLQDEDPSVREAAAEALASVGKSAVPALIEALTHEQQRVRFGATRALVLLKSDAKESIPALVDALDDPSTMVRFGAGRALATIGPEAIPAVVQGVKGSKPRVRYHSILVLMQFGPKAKDAIPALTAAISKPAAPAGTKGPHRDEHGNVAHSEQERMEILVRAAAADALGAMGSIAKPAVPAVLEAIKDPEPWVSNRAREAKMRIDPDDCDRGVLAMQSRDYEKALRIFTKLLGTNSDDPKYEWSPAQTASMTDQQKQVLGYLAECHQRLAEASLADSNLRRAQEHFQKWIQLRPNDPNPLLERGGAYLRLHNYAKALADLKQASELLPKKDARLATCYNNIAWILATCSQVEIRDGKGAIKYATEACEIQRTPIFVDTLAAAYAEAGNFEDAVEFQREALKQPGAFRLGLEAARARLRLYKSGKPYREE